jgi:Ser/Thr protein kinase RdoA (MazF antagonist)
VARERIDLSEVLQRYKARVIQITPLDGYYLVETNRGPKELRMWPRIDVMRWSFAWREQMARQGYREVERFIRTRDAKPYLVFGKKGFTLTDYLRNANPFLPTPETARQSGRLVARMHAAQQQNHLFQASDFLKQEQLYASSELRRARALEQEWGKHDDQVAELFFPMLERMERSAELLSSKSVDPEQLAVSHRDLRRDNWGVLNNKLILRGFYRPALSVQQRDIACYLRELFFDHEDEQLINAFLDGYEEEKPLQYGDYTLMLAFMAYPGDVWKSLERYMTSVREQGDASTAEIEQAIARQQLVDRLLRHVAHRAERARSGAAYEPI